MSGSQRRVERLPLGIGPAVSPEKITRPAMEDGIHLAVSGLHRWGVTLHHATNDTAAVVRLLPERHGFWADDIPHRYLFGGLLAQVPSELA
jgi:hypothetical protein